MLKRKWSLKLLLTFHVRGILHYVFEKVWLSASALHSCYSVAETFILKDNFINFIQHSTCFCKRFMWKSCEPRKSYKCTNFLAKDLVAHFWDFLLNQQVVSLCITYFLSYEPLNLGFDLFVNTDHILKWMTIALKNIWI